MKTRRSPIGSPSPARVQGRTVSRQRSTIALVRRPSTPTVIPSGRRRPMRATTHREGSPGLPTAVLAIGVPGSLLTLPSTRTPPVARHAGCPRPVLSYVVLRYAVLRYAVLRYAIRQSGRSLAAGCRRGGCKRLLGMTKKVVGLFTLAAAGCPFEAVHSCTVPGEHDGAWCTFRAWSATIGRDDEPGDGAARSSSTTASNTLQSGAGPVKKSRPWIGSSPPRWSERV